MSQDRSLDVSRGRLSIIAKLPHRLTSLLALIVISFMLVVVYIDMPKMVVGVIAFFIITPLLIVVARAVADLAHKMGTYMLHVSGLF